MQIVHLDGGVMPTSVAVSGRFDAAGAAVNFAITFGGITRNIVLPVKTARALANAINSAATVAETAKVERANVGGL